MPTSLCADMYVYASEAAWLTNFCCCACAHFVLYPLQLSGLLVFVPRIEGAEYTSIVRSDYSDENLHRVGRCSRWELDSESPRAERAATRRRTRCTRRSTPPRTGVYRLYQMRLAENTKRRPRFLHASDFTPVHCGVWMLPAGIAQICELQHHELDTAKACTCRQPCRQYHETPCRSAQIPRHAGTGLHNTQGATRNLLKMHDIVTHG